MSGPQSVHVSDPATNYFYEADDPSDGEWVAQG